MVGFKGQTQRHSSLCQTKITDYSGKESGLCKFVFICLLQIFFYFLGGGGCAGFKLYPGSIGVFSINSHFHPLCLYGSWINIYHPTMRNIKLLRDSCFIQ